MVLAKSKVVKVNLSRDSVSNTVNRNQARQAKAIQYEIFVAYADSGSNH